MKKIIAVILGIILIFCSISCSGNDNNKSLVPGASKENLKDSDYYLVKDRNSDYKIVFPSEGTYYETFAASELQNYFYEATGIRLPMISDDKLPAGDFEPYISVGNTKLFDESGITLEYEETKEFGYKIVNKGANLFLAGGIYAVHSAVYAFLFYQFDYEAFAVDEIYIKKSNGNVKMYEYDLFEKPDLFMIGNFAEIRSNRDNSLRMQQIRFGDVFLPVESTGQAMFHNFYTAFPERIYNNYTEHPESYHPEWYSNGQLNLSIAVDEMTDILVEFWKQKIEESETIGLGTEIMITFTQRDTANWSNADSSNQLYNKYKSYAAEYIIFINEAAKKFNKWLTENHPDRHIRYGIFAYQATEFPPNKKDNNDNYIKDKEGNYLAADETVILEDNVTLFYAPIHASFYYSFKDEENKQWNDILDRWMPIVNDNPTWYWLYAWNFEGQLVPLDWSYALQTNLQWAKEHNGEAVMIETDQLDAPAQNWSRLFIYLIKELGKNVNADVSALTDKFFRNYFKDAYEPMKRFYNEFCTHFAYLAETTNLTFNYMTENAIAASSNWPYGLLKQWLSYVDEAYETIAKYADSNSRLYNKLKERITLESITIRYLLLINWSARLNNKNEYVQSLIDDCASLGVVQFGQHAGTVEYHLKTFLD